MHHLGQGALALRSEADQREQQDVRGPLAGGVVVRRRCDLVFRACTTRMRRDTSSDSACAPVPCSLGRAPW